MTETHFSVAVRYNGGAHCLLPGQAVCYRPLKGKCQVQTNVLAVVLSAGAVLCEHDELNSLALIGGGKDWRCVNPKFKLRASQPVIGGRFTINPGSHPYGYFGHSSRRTWSRADLTARAWSEETQDMRMSDNLPDLRVVFPAAEGELVFWLPEENRHRRFSATHLPVSLEPAEMVAEFRSLVGRSVENVPLFLAWQSDVPAEGPPCPAAEYPQVHPLVYRTICPEPQRILRYALHPADARVLAAA